MNPTRNLVGSFRLATMTTVLVRTQLHQAALAGHLTPIRDLDHAVADARTTAAQVEVAGQGLAQAELDRPTRESRRETAVG